MAEEGVAAGPSAVRKQREAAAAAALLTASFFIQDKKSLALRGRHI